MSRRPSGREADPDLEEIAWLAAEIGAAPIAVVGLVGGHPPAFSVAARVGAGVAAAACARGLALGLVDRNAALVVPDLEADPRRAGDPATGGPLQARAFCGAPIRSPAGVAMGVVMVFDLEPRPFLPWQTRAIERLAGLAGRRLGEALESRAREARREEILGALAGGLALEIQTLQTGTGGVAGGRGGSLARAASLARDLLSLSGHRSQRPVLLDVNALVAERAADAAAACGRRLEIRLDRTIGPVAADGERLGRAVAGLVSRAAALRSAAAGAETFAGSAEDGNGLHLATSELAIAAGPASILPAGRYVLLTIGAVGPDLAWSFEASGSEDADGISGAVPGLAETRGMLRQSGARLGTATGASGLTAFCIALPRAAD
jgi:GAF domain-containing protein